MEHPPQNQYAPPSDGEKNSQQPPQAPLQGENAIPPPYSSNPPQGLNAQQLGYPTNPYPPGQAQGYNPSFPTATLVQNSSPTRLLIGLRCGQVLSGVGVAFLTAALTIYLKSRGLLAEDVFDTISLVLMIIGLVIFVGGIVIMVHFFGKLKEHRANAPPPTAVTVPIPSFPMYPPPQVTQQSEDTGPSLYPRQNYTEYRHV